MGRGKRWTKQEEQALLHGVGVYGVAWFQKNTGDALDWPAAPKGRTRRAVYSKAYRMYGIGGLSRGTYTLRRLICETGYGPSHFYRAMRACGQKWKRTSVRGRYLICEDQVDELLAWLRQDYWGKRHRLYRCSWCGVEHRRHHAQGLCRRCYQRYAQRLWRAGLPIGRKELSVELRKMAQCEQVSDFLAMAMRHAQRGWAIPEESLRRLIKERRHAD
jgi:hypothetical protein